MNDDNARDYKHDHRAQSEIDRWKARAEKAEADRDRMRAVLTIISEWDMIYPPKPADEEPLADGPWLRDLVREALGTKS